jgi:hypothetical protein
MNDTDKPGVAVDEFTMPSRRAVVVGVAAAAAIATVDANAQTSSSPEDEEMILFVLLSAALTGIKEVKLAPMFALKPAVPNGPPSLKDSSPGSDPVNVKAEYFRFLDKKQPKPLRGLLNIARKSLELPEDKRAAAIIEQVQVDVNTRYLARSIVLMWYLGAWYDPRLLREHAEATASKPPSRPLSFEVISPKAYTQGWALRIARAHPMGFSEFQFGYWEHEPKQDFIGRQIASRI